MGVIARVTVTIAERRRTRRCVLVKAIGCVIAVDVVVGASGEQIVAARGLGDLPGRVEGEGPLVVVGAGGQTVGQAAEPTRRIIAIAGGNRAIETRAAAGGVIGVTGRSERSELSVFSKLAP